MDVDETDLSPTEQKVTVKPLAHRSVLLTVVSGYEEDSIEDLGYLVQTNRQSLSLS